MVVETGIMPYFYYTNRLDLKIPNLSTSFFNFLFEVREFAFLWPEGATQTLLAWQLLSGRYLSRSRGEKDVININQVSLNIQN